MSLPSSIDKYSALRQQMVNEQIASRGINDKRVLEAIKKIPRHLFIPEKYWGEAYEDHPLPIGEEQTISQPFIVAYMTDALQIQPTDKVLEIGTGCGYQTAILAELSKQVYSIEYFPTLAEQTKNRLSQMGYHNIQIHQGNGFNGWKEYSPYDAIMVTCAPEDIPQSLVDQLAEGGRFILPLGPRLHQDLIILRKNSGKISRQSLLSVVFVPMLGEM